MFLELCYLLLTILKTERQLFIFLHTHAHVHIHTYTHIRTYTNTCTYRHTRGRCRIICNFSSYEYIRELRLTGNERTQNLRKHKPAKQKKRERNNEHLITEDLCHPSQVRKIRPRFLTDLRVEFRLARACQAHVRAGPHRGLEEE